MKLKEFIKEMGYGRTFKCYRNSSGIKIMVPKVDHRPAMVIGE